MRVLLVFLALTWCWAPAQAAAQGTELPLEVVDGHLVVPVQGPDGATLRFLVSSGTPQTIVSQSVADRFGADASLHLGDIALPERRMTWPDDEFEVGGTQLDGRLGVSLLRDYDLLVDVPGGRMVLGDIGTAATWPGLAGPTRVRVMHGSALMLDVELSGRTYPAIIDLATSTVVVNEGVQRDLSLGESGTASLTIGGKTMQDVPLRVIALDVFEMWSPNGDGVAVIGAAPFRECAISISWARAEIRTCGP